MTEVGGIAADALRQYVSRIERLQDERAGLSKDIADVYAQAKAMGFDKKALSAVIKLRSKSREEREELDQMVALYMDALGDAINAADHVSAQGHARAAE